MTIALHIQEYQRLVKIVFLVLSTIFILRIMLDFESSLNKDNVSIQIFEQNSSLKPMLIAYPIVAHGSDYVLPFSVFLQDSVKSNVVTQGEKIKGGLPYPKFDLNCNLHRKNKTTGDISFDAKMLHQFYTGSSMLALFEGHKIFSAVLLPGLERKHFVLQIVSCATYNIAREKYCQLHRMGIDNVFIDSAHNGNQKYRVRVGPFSSRQAVSEIQISLETLGYRSGYIISQ